MGKSKRWCKPTKYCEVVRSSGCLVVRWQKCHTRTKRNWAELHPDILLLIFKKVGAIDILLTARLVCQGWNRLLWGNLILWQRIDMTGHDYSLSKHAHKQIAKVAIDKSAEKLEEFYADGFVNDQLLLYIATRTNSLKILGLFMCPDISMKGLIAMADRINTLTSLRLVKCFEDSSYYFKDFVNLMKRLPMLEELELTQSFDSTWLCETIGPVCAQLKCFRWNNEWYSCHRNFSHHATEHDTEALHIGNNMHELRSLHLIGNEMTNKGLEAILEGCPYLEFLDIRHCFNLVLDENLMAKLSKIREVYLPDKPADDYFNALKVYNYDYYEFPPCLCCLYLRDDSDCDYDYDMYYYDTTSALDEMYGDVMFLY